MSLFFQGLLVGLSLSFVTGPMFFVLLQLGIEKGFRAGATAASGVWMSDSIYICVAYYSINHLLRITEWQSFQLWASLLGGLVLIVLGIGILLKKTTLAPRSGQATFVSHNWLGYWLKGFLVNALSPFTAVLWIGITSAINTNRQLLPHEALTFFGAIIGFAICADLTKVYLAKNLQNWMQLKHLLLIRKVAGIIVLSFGVILMIRGIIV
jgi:amino acid exporter